MNPPHHTSPRITFLPPKSGQSNSAQSSGKFEKSTASPISFQAPKFQDHNRSKFQQTFPPAESITTFLHPKAKEHKKPLLPQSNLNSESIICFLPPNIKKTTPSIVITPSIHDSAITFQTATDQAKLSEVNTPAPNPPSIQVVEENPIIEIQVDDMVILLKEEANQNSPAIASTPTSLLDHIPKNTPPPLDEVLLSTPQVEAPVEVIVESPGVENQAPKEAERVQSLIVKEISQQKGVGSIILIGAGVGGLVLLVLAWFLFREPQTPTRSSAELPKEETLQDPANKGDTENKPIPATPKPVAYAQVVTKKGSPLIIRAEKSKESAQIGRIPNLARVEILEYASYYSVLDGENGKWVYVKYQDKTGWCWGNFLKEIQQ